MTEHQFQRMVALKRRPQRASLFERPAVARWLERVARTTQRREDAAEAWNRVAEPEWLAHTRISGLAKGRLTIVVSDAALLFELRRRASKWHQALRPYVRGLREIAFVPHD